MKKFLSWVIAIAVIAGIIYINYYKEINGYEDGDYEEVFGDLLGGEDEPYRGHLFTNSKNCGDSRELKGNLLLAVIFVDENGNFWTGSEMETTKGEVYESTERLKREASGYGVSLEVDHQFLHSAAEEAVNKQNQTDWTKKALNGAGFSSEEKAIKELRSSYSATEAAILFAVKSQGRSFARAVNGNDEGLEYAILYQDLGGDYFHELLHVFGAKDFYYPDEVSALAKSCFPDSVMLNNVKEKTVDPLTAYLIGWTDSLSAEAERFLEGSASITSDELSEAYKEETKTGFGTVTKDNGSYTGYLANGVFHGTGIYTWNDGGRLIGSFSNGSPTSGTMDWANGTRYEGEFKDWQLEGKGKYFAANGDVLEGTFADGKISYGTCTWANGNRYEGEFKDWQPEGKGKYFAANGDVLEGTFAAGKISYGTCTWANGTRYEGEFKDWKVHGQGVCYFATGEVQSGQWYEGNFIG